MKRYMNVVNGVKRGQSIEVPDDAQPPADQWQEVPEVEPVDGATLVDGVWVDPVQPEPEPMTQAEWDAFRRHKIEKIEREAQTKMLEILVENAGLTLPIIVGKIRAIRAADNVGYELPEV